LQQLQQLQQNNETLRVLQAALVIYLFCLCGHVIRFVCLHKFQKTNAIVGGIFVLISIVLLGFALALTYQLHSVCPEPHGAVVAPAPAPVAININPAPIPSLSGDAGAPYPHIAVNSEPLTDGFETILSKY
ncbi:hypothetical protein PFISCL1PPCAC_23222, partial [Pristionchus fissidentatus]